MTIIIFILILAALIFVHEFGHFTLAKLFGIRVDEFALGFPPKIISKKYGETQYSLNLIPFGGYVKIFGEDAIDVLPEAQDKSRSFITKNRLVQGLVLSGGVLMNIIFAWVLLSITFMTGAPVSVEQYSGPQLENRRILVLDVTGGSPAEIAGIQAGDSIIGYSRPQEDVDTAKVTVPDFQKYISSHEGSEISITIQRGSEKLSVSATPKQGLLEGRAGIGIGLGEVGTLRLSLFPALYEGAKQTVGLTWLIIKSIAGFLYQAATLHANLNEVSGPVGIAVLVNSARLLGFFYIISFTALISLNLAVINLIPFPSLDGGRLLFVLMESVIRRPLPPRFTKTVNTIGFALLILLLVLVTFKDVLRLV